MNVNVVKRITNSFKPIRATECPRARDAIHEVPELRSSDTDLHIDARYIYEYRIQSYTLVSLSLNITLSYTS